MRFVPFVVKKGISLLIPQRHERVDRGGAAGGQVAGEECDDQQHGSDCDVDNRVGRFHAEEQRRNVPAEYEGGDQSDYDAGPGLPQALAQDQTDDLFARGADRAAHADFPGAL